MTGLTPGETVRVLLVTTDDAMQDQIQRILPAAIRDCRVYWVDRPDQAAARAVDLIPHVILVDDDVDGYKPAALVAQLAQRAPRAAILVLVGPRSLPTAQSAVLAGARAFVAKPLNRDELVASIRHMLSQSAPPACRDEIAQPVSGHIIVFCAPKGGTGRTTLAINTAIGLQRMTNCTVALIDADFASPALDIALSLDCSRSIADLTRPQNELDADLMNEVLARHASGVRVLLAPQDTGCSTLITLPQAQQVLAWLKRMFPWVVVDLGLPLNETSFAFLDGADRIVVSVLPEMIGLRNTRLMLDELSDRGYSSDRIWMVLNRSDIRGGVPVDDIEERLRIKIRHRVPDDQPLATYSVNRGVPLTMTHGDSRIGKAMHDIVEDLLQETGLAPQPAEPSHLLSRRFNRPGLANSVR